MKYLAAVLVLAFCGNAQAGIQVDVEVNAPQPTYENLELQGNGLAKVRSHSILNRERRPARLRERLKQRRAFSKFLRNKEERRALFIKEEPATEPSFLVFEQKQAPAPVKSYQIIESVVDPCACE